MPDEKIPMTPRGLALLKDELRRRKEVERPKIVRAIEEARAHGDLSENAEYSAAKEAQSFNEGRMKELEAMIALANVIDPQRLSGARIVFGATVNLSDSDSGEEVTYTIVGEHEADIKSGLISITAPVARALIGREVGDTVQVRTPKGTREYEVLEVRFVAMAEAAEASNS
jgi:transcription elongation factor GreA